MNAKAMITFVQRSLYKDIHFLPAANMEVKLMNGKMHNGNTGNAKYNDLI